MRIVTYNIHGWRTTDGQPNLVAVAETLEQIGADIVGLNEVHYPRVVAGSDAPALRQSSGRLASSSVIGTNMAVIPTNITKVTGMPRVAAYFGSSKINI